MFEFCRHEVVQSLWKKLAQPIIGVARKCTDLAVDNERPRLRVYGNQLQEIGFLTSGVLFPLNLVPVACLETVAGVDSLPREINDGRLTGKVARFRLTTRSQAKWDEEKQGDSVDSF